MKLDPLTCVRVPVRRTALPTHVSEFDFDNTQHHQLRRLKNLAKLAVMFSLVGFQLGILRSSLDRKFSRCALHFERIAVVILVNYSPRNQSNDFKESPLAQYTITDFHSPECFINV